MKENKWVYLATYPEAELMVIKPLLEESNIAFKEQLVSEGEVLRLYTSSAGILGAEIWVRAEDYQRANILVTPPASSSTK